jgi:hypothetical protein
MTATRKLHLKRLAAALAATLALTGAETRAFASSIDAVTSCADDNSPGTLRTVVAAAASGDQIDLSGLSCVDSKITLTQGEILIPHNATLFGPSSDLLTIVNNDGRVLNGASTDAPYSYLSIADLNISGGRVHTTNADAVGGCILTTSTLTLTNANISDCSALSDTGSAFGGAIDAVSISMQSSQVTGSTAYAAASGQRARGGGIYSGELIASDSTVSGNQAGAMPSGGIGQGGGAFISGGTVGLFRATINSNTADEGGGVAQFLYADTSSITIIENSTVSGNTALTAFGGFEAFCQTCTPLPLQISNSTVAFNASSGGFAAGVYTNGAVVAQSSIIADNRNTSASSNADLSASDLSGADNLIMSTDAPAAAGVITVTSDPQLSALADNGGPTWTHSLASGSPAIAQGNNSENLATDQRRNGFDREVDGMVDIGSYERQTGDDQIFGNKFD